MAKKHLELPESLGSLEILEEEVYPYCPFLSYNDKLMQCMGFRCAAFSINNSKCTLLNNKIKGSIKPHIRQK